jgi:hypothetical protein
VYEQIFNGKYRCFFAPARYRVVKITHSYFEVVLQTIKHTMVYPSAGPSLEVIALHPAI